MIHLEQPPSNTAPELSAYLMRMFRQVNVSFKDTSVILPPRTVLPTKILEGMVCNFTVAITPDIPDPGIYANLNKVWVKLTP